MLRRKSLGLFFLMAFIILTFSSLYGQKKDSLYYFSGQVMSKKGNYPVALAHIINLNRKWGVVADTLGNFEIWVKPGDTLNISAIGFEYLEYIVKGMNVDSIEHISLENRYYEIPEVSISYLGTYKDFEYKVLNLELPEIELNEQAEKLFKYDVEFKPYIEPTVTSPASLVYNLFSKNAKAIKKYMKVKENEGVVNKVNEKYNEHIVRNLTGLGHEEAYEFMRYCNFKDTFIINVSEYKLYAEILLKLEEYKKHKVNEELKE